MGNNISADVLRGAFILGAKRLDEKKDIINELNVFPVPDGDTGTNMSMTVNAALKEVENTEFDDIQVLCKTISQGALRGARGNSGVILSQLFRGFYKVIKGSNEVDIYLIAEAFSKATETAYRAVMKPKEGTILTVAKAISDRAMEVCHETDDFVYFYDEILKSAKKMLDRTPEMLPVLKQAGVVDSGGAGLIEILSGAADYIAGRDTDISTDTSIDKPKQEEIKLQYEISFDVYPPKKVSDKASKDLEVYLLSIGKIKRFDSGDMRISVLLHTNEPGRALTRALKTGEIDNVLVNNNNPNHEIVEDSAYPKPTEFKEMGFVTVAVGDGIDSIFKSLGADYCIKGGQTMNPSTDDILEAIERVYARKVFVLPNNKNILLAAQQAAKLTEDKEVIVIPTTTIPQGICALINFIPDVSAKENEECMVNAIGEIKSGEITYAVRDTIIGDKEIHEGDFMGIGDAGILAVDKKIDKCIETLIEEISDEDSSLLSIYYGEDVKESEAAKLVKKLSKKFPDFEIDLQNGGQPVYYYILSVE